MWRCLQISLWCFSFCIQQDGSLRPIDVGNFFRRLCSKLTCSYANDKEAPYLSHSQLTVGVKGGYEAGVHLTRLNLTSTSPIAKVILLVDYRNAFNCVDRDCLLNQVKEELPFTLTCYALSSLFGNNDISSVRGCQQTLLNLLSSIDKISSIGICFLLSIWWNTRRFSNGSRRF